MLVAEDQQADARPVRDSIDESVEDLPPAYDALSLHHSPSRRTNQHTSSSAFLDPSGPSNGGSDLPNDSDRTSPPSASNTSSLVQLQRVRKSSSWLSFLPFVSSSSAKHIRQSVLSVISDLVAQPSCVRREEQRNVHEILASLAETCAGRKLSLSTILQEPSIVDHTPMYWAIVNYREELLVTLLAHSRPLSMQTISDIRHACLVSSNQLLFQSLRVCRPPFHKTEGLQVPSLRAASHNLLLGDRPLDNIRIQQATDQAMVVSFDIPLWQRRMKAIGQVSLEFIASGRMWSITFFSTDPSSLATSKKTRKSVNTWYIMITLLGSSPPTFFDSTIVIDASSTLAPATATLREVRSATSRDKRFQNPLLIALTEENGSSSLFSYRPPPPAHPLRGSPSFPQLRAASEPATISIPLGSGDRKLARRNVSAEATKSEERPTTKPDTWSDHGVDYTSAVVVPLEDRPAAQLLHDHSRYLLPDGTLRGRLEARFIKVGTVKGCIIC